MTGPWALLSLLLRYPDDRVVAAAGDVAALPPGPVRDALERFLAGWTGDRAASTWRRSTCAGGRAST